MSAGWCRAVCVHLPSASRPGTAAGDPIRRAGLRFVLTGNRPVCQGPYPGAFVRALILMLLQPPDVCSWRQAVGLSWPWWSSRPSFGDSSAGWGCSAGLVSPAGACACASPLPDDRLLPSGCPCSSSRACKSWEMLLVPLHGWGGSAFQRCGISPGQVTAAQLPAL